MKQKCSSTAKLSSGHRAVLTRNPSMKGLASYAVDKPLSKMKDKQMKEKQSYCQPAAKSKSNLASKEKREHEKSGYHSKGKQVEGKIRAVTTVETRPQPSQRVFTKISTSNGLNSTVKIPSNPACLQGEFLKKILNQKRGNIQPKTQKNSKASSRRNSIEEKGPIVKTVSKKKKQKSIRQDEQSKKGKQQCEKQAKEKGRHSALSYRYSLGVKPTGVQKAQIEQALKLNYQKGEMKQEKGAEKNFMDLYKAYKKSFDIGSVRIDKGQSESRSSLFRHGSSLVVQQSHHQKNDQVNPTRTNKRQQSSQLPKRRFEKTIRIEPPSKPESSSQKEQPIATILEVEDKDESEEQVYVRDKIFVQFQEFQEELPSKIESGSSVDKQLQMVRGKVNNTSSTEEPCSQEDQQRIEKNFQNSKYYVRPVPSLIPQQRLDNLIDSESPIQPHPLETAHAQLVSEVEVEEFEL